VDGNASDQAKWAGLEGDAAFSLSQNKTLLFYFKFAGKKRKEKREGGFWKNLKTGLILLKLQTLVPNFLKYQNVYIDYFLVYSEK
jgi:hypothetical protein